MDRCYQRTVNFIVETVSSSFPGRQERETNPFVSSFDVVGIRSSEKEKRKQERETKRERERERERERKRESNIIDVFTRCPLRPAIFQRTEKRFSDKRPGPMPRGSQNLTFLRRRQPRSGTQVRHAPRHRLTRARARGSVALTSRGIN